MDLKPLIVEYLIITKQEDTFCDSDKAFIKFLGVDSSLEIAEKEKKISILKKNSKFTVSFSLVTGLVPSKKERYFKFTLSSKEQQKLKEFDELTSLIERIILKLNNDISINVLWNDISRQYAVEGYSLINEVENLLRRLIGSFMLINVGYDWHKYHIPSEVENRDLHLKNNYSNYLHQTYFSDLKKILFDGQRDINFRNIGDIQKLVERHISDKKQEINVNDLVGVISKSLWEKHFAKETNYKKKDLEEDLEKLNSLRNEIAHNRHITREALGKIQNLSQKIIKTLKLEIEDLPNKVLTPEEQFFQANREDARIAVDNPTLSNYLSELALIEWYKTLYGTENVVPINQAASDIGADILVRSNNGKEIGVEVRLISALRLLYGRKTTLLRLTDILLKNSYKFDERHLVVIVKDYEQHKALLPQLELEELKEIAPGVKIIFGQLDEDNQFYTLA